MEETEVLICSDCACESTEASVAEAVLGGWNPEAEYGALCPGCSAEHIHTNGSEGMAALAEVLGVKKAENVQPPKKRGRPKKEK